MIRILTLLTVLTFCGIAVAQNPSQSKQHEKAMKKAAKKSHHEPYEYQPHAADTDGDGVNDYTDKCPDTPKGHKVTTFGCPFDTDFDGLYDYEDSCVTEPGPRENHGCPWGDKDKDGITDNVDQCPDAAGPKENKGCPWGDRDKDGIIDKEDKCPDVPGLAKYKGCPDTDGDGIPDDEDLCPKVPGIKENRGCPPIKKEDEAVIKRAFDNLLFKTGEDVILPSSFKSLNELAAMMQKNPTMKLHLEGHTDDVGDDAANMLLSENRAKSVKRYLTNYGIKESRIYTAWYGETRPKSTNDTEQGRKLNRRVEMNLTYD